MEPLGLKEGTGRVVLVVDDEEGVRTALRRTLEPQGYTVLQAAGGEEALRILDGQRVHLIITDHNMPGLTGVDLLKLVRVRHPDVLRVILTGQLDPEIAIRSINEGEVYRFIRKPWNTSDLRTLLHFAFEVVRLEEEKRRLIALVRKQQQQWQQGLPPGDADQLEAELLMLAEDEIEEEGG